METPDYVAGILAKSADRETLFEHTWHVLSRFANQVHLHPDLPAHLNSPRLWHRLYWACFLHDFGKVATGFQEVLRANPSERKRWPYRHEVGSLAFIGWLFPNSVDEDYRWVVAAIVSHHKDANTINGDYKDGSPAIRQIAQELAESPLEALWRWVDEYGARWQTELQLTELGIEQPTLLPKAEAVALVREGAVVQIEQALQAYRDLLTDFKEDPILRKQAVVTVALRGITITADHSASAHTGAPPLLPIQDYTAVVQQLGWSLDQLHQHQEISATTPGNAVLIAPTGSGKTEAAMFWAFGTTPQQLPRLFYALPYQASMNAMHARLERMFPDAVGLQHGRALQALYRAYIEEGDNPSFAIQRAKDRKNRTELNYFPVRVFSPYQMLKACYKLRGYEAILSDYFDGAFIFDEIHAYEPKRLALILTLISHLRQHYQARFFVMSATFPDLIKLSLHQALGGYIEVMAGAQVFKEFQRHKLQLLDGDMLAADNINHIATTASQNTSVLVCCNTVARAQDMWRNLREQIPEATIVLLHSRLNGRDRLQREKQVMDACGLKSDQRQPIILVATQVVEVSLNIDLDTIYTDPAPLEALIQRFGRVNRGGSQRNELGERVLAPVHVFREPIPEENLRPYDRRLLVGTLRLLEEQNGLPVDESAVNDWLNTIYTDYGGDYVEEWHRDYNQAAKDFRDGILHSLIAFNADKELEKLFYQAFDSIDVLPKSFEQTYFELMGRGEFIEAASLTVSMASWQYSMLKNRGKLQPGNRSSEDVLERVTIVNTPYDEDVGLLFE